jgi:hypothetical protein
MAETSTGGRRMTTLTAGPAVTVQIDIGEIVIDGPAMSRREREELRATLEVELADRLGSPPARTDRHPDRGPSRSDRTTELARGIAAGIASALPASLPRTNQGGGR